MLKDPPVVALLMSHGASSLDFQLRAFVMFADFVRVSSELAIMVNQRFTAEGIEIPSAQSDLNLKISPEVAETLGLRGRPSS